MTKKGKLLISGKESTKQRKEMSVIFVPTSVKRVGNI